MTATETMRADIDEIMPGVIADRRYLHQHRFRTWVTGKYDLLLTAVRSAPAARTP